MLKKLFPIILLCGLLLLTACGKAPENTSGHATEETSSTAVTDSSTPDATPETSIIPSAPDSSETSSTVTAANSQAGNTATSTANNKAGATNSKPSVSSANAPTQSQAVASKAPATSTPVPSKPTPAFDPQPYYDYAKSYGISQGLKFDSTMNKQDNAWDQPLSLYSALSESTMQANIRSGINFIIHEGNTDFGLYLEKQADGYYLYMFYA